MIVAGANHICLMGPLTSGEVVALYEEGYPSFEGGECLVDMRQVEIVDSSAIALLLSWLRAAQRANGRLVLAHVPPNLQSLASMYGVADVLFAHVRR